MVTDKLAKIEQLLKEIKEDNPKIRKDADIGKITDEVFNRVMDKIKKEGIGTKILLQPIEYVLEKFQEKEIQRWEEKINELDEDCKKIGAFAIALGKQTTKNEIISKVFGSQYTSGSAYQGYSEKIDRLIQTLVLRTDKKKRIYPNVEETVRANLETYSPNEEKIKNVTDRILRIFIGKIE